MNFEIPKLNRITTPKGVELPVEFVRKTGCKRYILRLSNRGTARLTLPYHGNVREASTFLGRNLHWLDQQIEKRKTAALKSEWTIGSLVLVNGKAIELRLGAESNCVQFGEDILRIPEGTEDLKPAVQAKLISMANEHLPRRTIELAESQGLEIRRISIRSQRTRWGSCSIRKHISLNWRLIQTPPFVQDYIILHELMHLRQMNHSPKYWAEVEKVCPNYMEAEKWLRENGRLLRDT